MPGLRIVCLSDTHGRHDELEVPAGDVLVHAGDFTMRGRGPEVRSFGEFLARQPHRHKVVVAGNHDFLFEDEPEHARALLGDVTYLCDSGVTVEGLSLWGSPWQPRFHDWAFNLDPGPALAAKWARVPSGVDVLVTHTPPFGVLDVTSRGPAVGCEDLGRELARIGPKLHVFGHIHEARGVVRRGETLHVNACNCNLQYRPAHAPIVVEWDGDGARPVI